MKSEEERAKDEEDETKQVLEEYGLGLDKYDTKRIQQEIAKNLKNIAKDIAGNKWIKAGMALSFSAPDKQAELGYLSAIVNQNWILIRQNELIIRFLKKGK